MEQLPNFNQPEQNPAEQEPFVSFGEIARNRLGMQTQYASRYVNGFGGEYPNCGEGLRFKGKIDDYHSIEIHSDDVEEFVARVLAARK